VTDPRDAAAVARDAARVAALALAEDGGRDVTSMVVLAPDQQGVAVIEAREPLVLAGRAYADAVVTACGLPAVEWHAADGDRCPAGQALGHLAGSVAAILQAERPLLNLLQRACGIATMTRACTERVAGTKTVVLHTRKTTPGLRLFEVRAVLDGGGGVHRLDLATTVMVKDNHWQALRAGEQSLAGALDEARTLGVADLQVEVESLEQVEEACRAGATRLLIDNQSPAVVAAWAARAWQLRPEVRIEATGGITLDTMRAYADAGADFISTGMLTHTVRSVDIGLEITED
jgi:nicotinate-nucleotide pyrophosphorylase (carboxylating)